MTTSVTIKTHDWAVDVYVLEPNDDPEGVSGVPPIRVEKNSEQTVYVWQGRDLRIHEVKNDT